MEDGVNTGTMKFRLIGYLAVVAVAVLVWPQSAQAGNKLKDGECLACHSDPSLTTESDGKQVKLSIDAGKLHVSVHGTLSCVDCHKDVKTAGHEQPPAKVECSQCHADEQAAYGHSFHGAMKKADGTPAATCQDCHGDAHQILPGSDANSPVSHAKIPTTCGQCHGQKFLMQSNGETAQTFVAYQESVHGRAVANGSEKAAVCTDCHGAHEILPPSDPKSPIYKLNVPATCGGCHAKQQSEFDISIHGTALAKGNGMAPTCTDCHGIHSIKAHNDPNSPVSDQNLARTTCARCHEGVQLSQEFGVAGGRESTYLDSYHGLASKGGSVLVANCDSCHGAHNILPSSDPRSTINPANLDVTCGQCHKGVTQKFTQNKVHMDGGAGNDKGTVAVRWVRLIYVPLIVLVIGGMFLHNAIIWRSKTMARKRARGATVVRMTTNQRWQHLLLLTSFFVLVFTGFALKYPDTWFAQVFGMGEKLRGIIHRIAGVVLIGTSVYHVIYAVMTREGRKLVKDLAPMPYDLTDVLATMLYYLGLRKERPTYRRFNYAEKAEYWALVWGTGLMAVTGTMLWAKVWVGNLLARWWVDAATAVHFYEAILATLAIVVWHLYQVIFDPDVYPMNWAWRDGQIDVEHYEHEHGLDKDSLEQAVNKDSAEGPEQGKPQK